MDAPGLGHLLGIVTPVFALVAAGALLGRWGVLTPGGRRDLHLVVYYVALPAQLVVELGRSDLRAHVVPGAILAAVVSYLLGFLATWFATVGMDPASRGAVLNGTVRSNGAFIGLPVALLLSASLPAAAGIELTAVYLVLLGVLVPVFNLGSVMGFLLPHHGLTPAGMRLAGLQALTNPLLIACVLGATACVLVPRVPPGIRIACQPLEEVLHLMGGMAVPAALLLAGAQLDPALMRRRAGIILAASTAKLLIMPLVGWTMSGWCGLDGPSRAAVVLILAAPTAMASVPMAAMMAGDAELMSAQVATSTALAPLTLLLWLAMVGPAARG